MKTSYKIIIACEFLLLFEYTKTQWSNVISCPKGNQLWNLRKKSKQQQSTTTTAKETVVFTPFVHPTFQLLSLLQPFGVFWNNNTTPESTHIQNIKHDDYYLPLAKPLFPPIHKHKQVERESYFGVYRNMHAFWIFI